jgi:transcriptional regulator with XRE-family HTH domain
MATYAHGTGIAEVLREWRERRRVSQLELALRAGTTQRYVSFIERGRSLPGRAMVVRLAEALEVPLRARNTMLLAAGYAPAYAETSLDDPELDPVRAALERILDGHAPYPAVVTDSRADLVAANDAFSALIQDASPVLREPPVNLPRVLLHPDGLAQRILNLEEWGRHVIDGLGRKAARQQNPQLAALIEELEPLVPPLPREPSPHHVGFAVPLRLRGPDGELELLTTLTHFATATNVTISELTLEAFIPSNPATAAYFERVSRESRRVEMTPLRRTVCSVDA